MSPRTLVALLLLLPSVGAYELGFGPDDPSLSLHQVAPGIEAVPAPPGDPVTARLVLTDGGEPVQHARIRLASGVTLTTNADGVALFSFFEDGGKPHLQTEEVESVEVRSDGVYTSVAADLPSLSVLWTDLRLRTVAPAEVRVGDAFPVTVEAYWERTGHPALGVWPTLTAQGSSQRAQTGPDGAAFQVTPQEEGDLLLSATVAPADRPNGVAPLEVAQVEVSVTPASSGGDSGDGSGSGSGNGSGSGSDNGSGDGSGDASEPDGSGDEETVESGPAPEAVTDPATLREPEEPPADSKPFESPGDGPPTHSNGTRKETPAAGLLPVLVLLPAIARRMIP